MASNIADDADRPRKGDVTPDSQRRRYEERGGETTSIGDEIDSAYDQGRADASRATPQGRAVALRKPAGIPSIGAPLAVALVLISVDEFTNQHRPPVPSRLLSASVIFGILGLAKGDAAQPAAVFAWGLVLATFYSTSVAGKKPGGIAALTTIGNFIGGKYGKAGQPQAAAAKGK